MGQLISRALAAVFFMGLVAFVVAGRHPAGQAPAAASGDLAVIQNSAQSNPWSDAPAPQGVNAPAGPKILTRDSSGQFHVDGFVDGRQTQFLVDTGADLVALPEREAERLGIAVREEDFRPMLQTASGTADGAKVMIDRLDVAGASLTHVPAVVVRGLDVNLLGQAALRRFGKVTLRGDTMVIEPN
jgi:aspartyl protease family protein